MYEAFYGLETKPFNLTPDPRFLFLSEKHKEAFAHLLFGIKNRTGFVVITGEVGTGKTTICRTLLGQLDENTEAALVFNPVLSPEELLRKINEEFGIDTQAASIKGLIDELNEYVLARNAEGKNCVIVIDEAQRLTPDVLEQIRLLSNLETDTEKILQIILVGQPELKDLLALEELRQLDQRITARYHLNPLDATETMQYIAFRLRTAGAGGNVRFTRPAVRAVYKHSGGVPRVINAICDRALLIGYTREVQELGKDIVNRAAREVRGDRPARRKRRGPSGEGSALGRLVRAPFKGSLPTVVAATIVILVGGKYVVDRLAPSPVHAPAPNLVTLPAPPLDQPVGNAAEAVVPDPIDTSLRPVVDSVDVKEEDPREVLNNVLAELDPVRARNAGAVEILRRWSVPLAGGYPGAETIEAFAAFAVQNGLSHEAFLPTLDQLIAVDLPALVLVGTAQHTLWVALVGVQADGVLISTDLGETALVSRDELSKRFFNQAVVLWRDPTPTAKNIRQDDKGGNVRELQERLREAGLWSGDATGVYDAATVDAVTRLQVRAGLKTDGITGQQTRMVLCSLTSAIETPSLRKPDARPAPPEIGTPAVRDRVAAKNVVEEPAEPAPAPTAVEAESPPPPSAEQPPPADTPPEEADSPAPDQEASDEAAIEEDRIVSEELDPVMPENGSGTAVDQLGADEHAGPASWQTGTEFPLTQSARKTDGDKSS